MQSVHTPSTLSLVFDDDHAVVNAARSGGLLSEDWAWRSSATRRSPSPVPRKTRREIAALCDLLLCWLRRERTTLKA
jgi:hypothetical protein